jgi:hypothetical protein
MRGGGGQVTTPLFLASLNATKQQDTPLLTALAVIMKEICIRGGQQTVTFVEKPAETQLASSLNSGPYSLIRRTCEDTLFIGVVAG